MLRLSNFHVSFRYLALNGIMNIPFVSWRSGRRKHKVAESIEDETEIRNYLSPLEFCTFHERSTIRGTKIPSPNTLLLSCKADGRRKYDRFLTPV